MGALLLAPAAGLAANAALHALLARAGGAPGPIRLQFVAFGAGALVTVILLAAMLAPAGYFILHALIYLCFAFCLFNLISANVSSLRVRILKEMLLHHPAPMEQAALAARYSASEILLSRLARLEGARQVEARGGRYYLRKGGLLYVAAFFARLRALLLSGRGAP